MTSRAFEARNYAAFKAASTPPPEPTFPLDDEVRGRPLCAYRRATAAVNQDHVIPRVVRKRFGVAGIPEELLQTVPCCFACNHRKGARALVPPSWADRVPALKQLLPRKAWRVWDGDPASPMIRGVHLP